MKAMLTILAAIGLAPAAGAQEWLFELSNPVLSLGSPSTTVTISIDPGPGAYALAGVNLGVHATEPGWSENMGLRIQPGVIWDPGPAHGVISGPSVLGISNGQLGPPLGFVLVPGRVDVWRATFTVTDFTAREVDLHTETSRLSVYLDASGTTRVDRTPVEGHASITVIPAPAAAALLGLSAMPALRRRRRRKEATT